MSDNLISFQTYGVRIGIKINESEMLEKVRKKLPEILPTGFEAIDSKEIEHLFYFRLKQDGDYELQLQQKGRENIIYDECRGSAFDLLDNQLHLTIGEFTNSYVFIHAGVVSWKGKAIIIPARSFQGKTTLLAELVKQGAEYYSDEFALIDNEGYVHPFPLMLSVYNTDDESYKYISIESIGGKTGTTPIPAEMVLITEYKSGAAWKPKKLDFGSGLTEMALNTVPMRHNPAQSLKVLSTVANQALMVKSKRGEAKEAAQQILKFADKKFA